MKAKQVSFKTIVLASKGDEEAIESILLHYNNYISKLSVRPVHDDYGNTYMMVDSELQHRIRMAIINMVLKFKIEIV